MLSRTLSPEEDVIRPIVAVRVINPVNGRREEVYALLDSGADRDYLSERVADTIGLSTRKRRVNLVTVEEASRKEREMADVEFESLETKINRWQLRCCTLYIIQLTFTFKNVLYHISVSKSNHKSKAMGCQSVCLCHLFVP